MASFLIADDDALSSEFIGVILKMQGHEFEAVSDGEAAIAALQREPFDVAIIDIFMPVKDGIETIIQMRKQFPDTRVIAMSGGRTIMPTSTSLDFALQLGAHEVLAKPFTVEGFKALIANVLAGREGPNANIWVSARQ